ncbi:MAG: type II secretion system F family protein [Planctomycetota bacterium]
MKLTLDDFQQLSVEIGHLVRAGLPLEQTLAAASGARGTRLLNVAETITRRLESGDSLTGIVSDPSLGVPRILSSAIAAGIRSGNVAVTIELMGSFAADILELRQRLISALTYPMTILATASILMMIFLANALQRVFDSVQSLEIAIDPWLLKLLEWNSRYPEWVLVFPAMGIMMFLLWLLSGRASSLTFRGPERLLLLLPGIRSMIRDLQQYTMTRMMSLLTERQVPLDVALVLSGGASGSRKLQLACDELAGEIRKGLSVGDRSQRAISDVAPHGFQFRAAMSQLVTQKPRRCFLPPLLEASLAQVDRHEARLSQRLRSVAQFYRGRLERNATWIRMLMPVVALIVIGGGSVFVYASALFWPVAEIYSGLGQ